MVSFYVFRTSLSSIYTSGPFQASKRTQQPNFEGRNLEGRVLFGFSSSDPLFDAFVLSGERERNEEKQAFLSGGLESTYQRKKKNEDFLRGWSKLPFVRGWAAGSSFDRALLLLPFHHQLLASLLLPSFLLLLGLFSHPISLIIPPTLSLKQTFHAHTALALLPSFSLRRLLQPPPSLFLLLDARTSQQQAASQDD